MTFSVKIDGKCMKRLENIIVNIIFSFLYVIVACIGAMIIEWGATYVIDKFVELNYLTLTIIRTAIYSVTVFLLIFIFAYKEAYRDAHASIVENIIAMSISASVHLILAILFNFSGFISGPVRFAYLLIKFGDNLSSSEQLKQIARIEYVPMFIVFYLICAIIMLSAKKLGFYRRIISRTELKKNEKADPVENENPQ